MVLSKSPHHLSGCMLCGPHISIERSGPMSLRLVVITLRSNFSIFSPLCNKLSYLPFYEVLNTTLYFPWSVIKSVILTKA